jgi:hypothetical protein
MEISFNNIPPGNYFCGSSYVLSEQGWFPLQQSIQLPIPRILLMPKKQTTNSKTSMIGNIHQNPHPKLSQQNMRIASFLTV